MASWCPVGEAGSASTGDWEASVERWANLFQNDVIRHIYIYIYICTHT